MNNKDEFILYSIYAVLFILFLALFYCAMGMLGLISALIAVPLGIMWVRRM